MKTCGHSQAYNLYNGKLYCHKCYWQQICRSPKPPVSPRKRRFLHDLRNAIIVAMLCGLVLTLVYCMDQRHEVEVVRWEQAVAETATPAAMPVKAAAVPTTQTAAPMPEATPTPYIPDPTDAVMLAKLTYGEARGVESITQQAAVMWSVLNRADAEGYGMGVSIEYVVTFPAQFQGYDPNHPTVDDFGRDLVALAEDVLTRWATGGEGRVLPAEYMWFEGDGDENYFYNAYQGGDVWDWSLPSPYES